MRRFFFRRQGDRTRNFDRIAEGCTHGGGGHRLGGGVIWWRDGTSVHLEPPMSVEGEAARMGCDVVWIDRKER